MRLDELKEHRFLPIVGAVDPAELPDRVGEVVGHWIRETLAAVSVEERPDAAVAISTAVLEAIAGLRPAAINPERRLTDPIRHLTAVERLAPTDRPIPIARPITPLRDTVLMTNARDQPAVGSEIAAEIESADRIDLVLAFIRWTGVRDLLPALQRHVEQGDVLRMITTTYTGSTLKRGAGALVELGAESRCRTTIHTHASTPRHGCSSAHGFSTVYIGPSQPDLRRTG